MPKRITVDVPSDGYGNEYHAEIVPGMSISIFGVFRNCAAGPQSFDKIFAIGDMAEYDSYYTSYTSPIVAIGPKTVTFRPFGSEPARRLGLTEFCSRNWDFDLAAIKCRNAEWLD